MAKPVYATNDVPSADEFNQWLVNTLYARKTANQTVTSSTTLVVDNDLSVAVVANATYWVNLLLAYGGSASADIKVLLRTPAGGGFQGFGVCLIGGAGSQQDIQNIPYGANTSEQWGIIGAGTQYGKVEGLLTTAGTAGNFQIEWAQFASNATGTVVQSGSYLFLRRLD